MMTASERTPRSSPLSRYGCICTYDFSLGGGAENAYWNAFAQIKICLYLIAWMLVPISHVTHPESLAV
jgi:hypothetical protein